MEYNSYKEYLNGDEWKHKRANKINGSRICAFCGSENNLQVHHLTYRRGWGNESSKDLRVVCRRCHTCIHELFRDGLLSYGDTKKQNHKKLFSLTQEKLKERYNIRFMSKQQRTKEEREIRALLRKERQDLRDSYNRFK